MEIASTYIKAQQPKTADVSAPITAEGNDLAQISEKNTVPSSPLPQTALLTETLQLNGLKPTPENLQMLMQMLDAGIPLTTKNIAQMNQAFKMTQNLEKALFLFQNDIPITSKNASQLNTLAEGQTQITKQINTLLEGISLLKDTALKDVLVKLLESLSHEKQTNNAKNNVPVAEPQDSQKADSVNKPQPFAKTAATQAIPMQASQAQIKSPAAIAAFAESVKSAKPAVMSSTNHIPVIPQKNIATAQIVPQAVVQAQATPVPVTQAASQAYNTFQAEAAVPAQELPEAILQGKMPQPSSAQSAQLTQSPQPTQSQPTAQPSPTTPQSEVVPQALSMPETGILKSKPQVALPQEQANSSNLLAESSDLSALQKKLSLPLESSSVQNMENFVNNLREILAQATLIAENSQHDPSTARVLRDIQVLTEKMDFTNQIKNQIYVQVPLTINDQTFNTALFVNKDGKNGQKSKKDSGSALIALDTAWLGHFETYVQKEKQAIHCQFKLKSEEVEQLVRANIHKLDAQLKEYSYILESFTFVINDQPFTILDAAKQENSLNLDKVNRRSDTVFEAMA
ncbi:MAG: hypothetical protein FWC91_14240 [Defluviitaleaceae bacterium]|nr:hypothetical protein [Defluviitaleaceae bacterium]